MLRAEPSGLTPVACANATGTGGCSKVPPLSENTGDVTSVVANQAGTEVFVDSRAVIIALAWDAAADALRWSGSASACVSNDGSNGSGGHCVQSPDGVDAQR